MYRRLVLLTVVAAWSQNAPPATGSISGVVRYESGALPEVGTVRISPGGHDLKIDSQGHYSLHDLAPGTYYIGVQTSGGRGPTGSRLVALSAGQDMTVDFRLADFGSVAGRVLDENKEPVPGVSVFLVAREYSLGKLRYVRAFMERTNDQGEYKLPDIPPGRGYLVLADKLLGHIDAISDAPADPNLRRRTQVPTFYPGTDSIEGAEVLTLRPGERRQGVDIRLLRSPSYCIVGVLEGANGPAALIFFLDEQRPTDGMAFGRGMYTTPAHGSSGPDGKIRICNLHPGDYRLTAFDYEKPFFGTSSVSITDNDARNVRVVAQPRLPVPGEVVWDGKPPDEPLDSTISIALYPPVGRGFMQGEDLQAKSSIPGEFSFRGLIMGDYPVDIRGLPDKLYVKDITYSGQSILHKTLSVGSGIGKATLRVVVSPDGGTMKGKVADKDGNAVPDCFIAVMPASADSEAEMTAAVDFEVSDQNGTWSTHRMAPGKYYVVASQFPFDLSPEGAARLWHARMSAHEVDLDPGAAEQVIVTPMVE